MNTAEIAARLSVDLLERRHELAVAGVRVDAAIERLLKVAAFRHDREHLEPQRRRAASGHAHVADHVEVEVTRHAGLALGVVDADGGAGADPVGLVPEGGVASVPGMRPEADAADEALCDAVGEDQQILVGQGADGHVVDVQGPHGDTSSSSVGEISEGTGAAGATRPAALSIIGESGPEIVDLPRSGNRPEPSDTSPSSQIVRLVRVDGKVLAEAVIDAEPPEPIS